MNTSNFRIAASSSVLRIHSVEQLMIRSLITIAVLAHLIVSILHGYAHMELAVHLSQWQTAYVFVVITAAPLVSLALLWLRKIRLGLLLFAMSMAGSLVFGVYYHYIAISPDHVSHLPSGDSQGLFRLTAFLLGLTEGFGFTIALLGFRGSLPYK